METLAQENNVADSGSGYLARTGFWRTAAARREREIPPPRAAVPFLHPQGTRRLPL